MDTMKLLSMVGLSSLTPHTICNKMKVGRTIANHFVLILRRYFLKSKVYVVLTRKTRLTFATLDAHIYSELVDIYILAGQNARENVDSGYCVPYPESC